MNDNLPGLTPLWLISLALVLGVVIVTFVPMSISGGDTIKGSDWIGFAGSVIAGAMTLMAGIIAWFSVQRQIKAQEQSESRAVQRQNDQRQIELESAKYAAVIVLTQPIHAAAAAMSLTKKYIKAKAEQPDRVGLQEHGSPGREAAGIKVDLDKMMNQLRATLEHFAVAEAWKDLGVEDKANYLVITSALQTLTNIYSSPATIAYARLVFNQHDALTNFSTYVRAFDGELADVYDRDSNVGLTEPVITEG